MNPLSLVSIIWTQSVGLVLFGLDLARAFSRLIVDWHSQGGAGFALLALLLLLVEGLLLWFLSSGLPRRDRVVFLGSFLLLTLLSIAGSQPHDKLLLVSAGDFQRYFYAPNAILLLLILANVRANHGKIQRGVAAFLLVSSLALGVASFSRTTISHDDWPKWTEQVQMWEQDPEHSLETWPPGWTMQLAKPDR
jgi:hypothetical protein